MMNQRSVLIETKFFLWLRNKIFAAEEENKEYQAIDRQRKINRYINIAKKKKSVDFDEIEKEHLSAMAVRDKELVEIEDYNDE